MTAGIRRMWLRSPRSHARGSSAAASLMRPRRPRRPVRRRPPARAIVRARPASRRPPGRRPGRTAAAPRPGSGRTPPGSAGGSGSRSARGPRRASRRRGSSARARVPASGGSGDGETETSACVYGLRGRADDRLGRADLHDLAEVHDRDPVGDDPGQRQVVGDEQVGQAALATQVEHQPQELGPDRDVEHRHRLVGDDDLRVHDQRTGDDDALALAAGQLVRVAEGEVGWPAAARPIRAPRRPSLRARSRVADPVHDERLGDEVVDRLLRVRASRTGPGR